MDLIDIKAAKYFLDNNFVQKNNTIISTYCALNDTRLFHYLRFQIATDNLKKELTNIFEPIFKRYLYSLNNFLINLGKLK